jgi:hypothetical protein
MTSATILALKSPIESKTVVNYDPPLPKRCGYPYYVTSRYGRHLLDRHVSQNRVTPPAPGERVLKISYVNGGLADLFASITVDGGAAVKLAFPPTGGWDTPGVAVATVNLQAGVNTVEVSNPTGRAPDVDKLAIPASLGA